MGLLLKGLSIFAKKVDIKDDWKGPKYAFEVVVALI